MNLSVNVMGEVNRPGRYNIDKDHLTILDALSRAGDLTIYGKREKVSVLRNENGKRRVYGINLCSADHLYSSPVYYLQQNDVVYVEPNDTKARRPRLTAITYAKHLILDFLGIPADYHQRIDIQIIKSSLLLVPHSRNGNPTKKYTRTKSAGLHPNYRIYFTSASENGIGLWSH